MKKLISGVMLVALAFAPTLAGAAAGTAVMKDYYGEGVALDRDIAHAMARHDGREQARREGYGNCVEVTAAFAEMTLGWHATSGQQCARL